MGKLSDSIIGFLVGTFLAACLLVAAIYFLREDAQKHYGEMYEYIPPCWGECPNPIERMKE